MSYDILGISVNIKEELHNVFSVLELSLQLCLGYNSSIVESKE